MPKVTKPHDKLVLQVLGKPEHAAPVLQAMLPDAIAQRIDWTSLNRAPERYAPKHTDPSTVDLLFQAKVDGRDGFLYFLFEHQSEAHPLMPWRMLRYLLEIGEHHLAEHPGATTVPAIIPALLCHGPTPWNGPKRLLDCFDLPRDLRDQLGAWLPNFTMLMEDLGAITHDELRARILPPAPHLVLLTLQTVRETTDVLDDIDRWTDVFRALLKTPSAEPVFEAIIWYVLNVADVDPAKLTDHVAARLGPEPAQTIMTTAERLKNEGRAEGRASTVLKQLQLRFGDLSPDVVARVKGASEHELDTWAERILSADTLDGVLDG